MKSPGKLLREAREERGLTLEDVAAMTRIPKGMLDHLESDRFEEYVADVFARGHLRNFANELGIDADEVLQAYEHHTGKRDRDKREASANNWSTPMGIEKKATSSQGSSSPDSAKTSSGSVSAGLVSRFSGVRRSHFIAVVLVLVGLFMMFGYLSNNRATAQDTAEYEDAELSDWELQQDVEETRWLLEQSEDTE